MKKKRSMTELKLTLLAEGERQTDRDRERERETERIKCESVKLASVYCRGSPIQEAIESIAFTDSHCIDTKRITGRDIPVVYVLKLSTKVCLSVD